MVWACFCGNKIRPILPLHQGGIGAVEYMEILSGGLMSIIDDLLGHLADQDTIRVVDENSLLFMHDNAPCHRDRRVSKLLHKYSIPVMHWPPQSPDLNPLELTSNTAFTNDLLNLGHVPLCLLLRLHSIAK